MPFPLAISGITSLASAALDAWSRAKESQQSMSAPQSTADFQRLLASATAAGRATGGSQQGMASLPEVKAALASVSAGTAVQITVSPDGQVVQTLPGGMKQAVPLSASSQALVRQWMSANPGSGLSVSVVA